MLLKVLPQKLSVMRLDASAPFPEWASDATFFSITRACSELSIFCDSDAMPDVPEKIDGWRAFYVAGNIDLALAGVISSLALPLAMKQIPIFSISTHDTDYMVVRENQLDDALDVLRRAGHSIELS